MVTVTVMSKIMLCRPAVSFIRIGDPDPSLRGAAFEDARRRVESLGRFLEILDPDPFNHKGDRCQAARPQPAHWA